MTTIRRATEEDIQTLSERFLHFLDDKNGKIYQENVVRFGIPDEYVRKAFAEGTLLKAATSGKAVFYIALEDDEIAGFAQTIQQDPDTGELDRIVVFPSHERKGIGTQLLKQAVEDLRKKGTKTIVVNAGKNETHARRFYEKNGFQLVKETSVQAPWGKKLELAVYHLQIQ